MQLSILVHPMCAKILKSDSSSSLLLRLKIRLGGVWFSSKSNMSGLVLSEQLL